MLSCKVPKSSPRCIGEKIEQRILTIMAQDRGLYSLALDDTLKTTYANGLTAIFEFARGEREKAISLYLAINREIGKEDGCYNWAKEDNEKLPEANLTMAILLKLLGYTSAARDLEQHANKFLNSHAVDADTLALKGILHCLLKNHKLARSLYRQINEQVTKRYGLYMTTPKWKRPIAYEPNSLMNGIMGIFCYYLGRKEEAVELCRTVHRVIGIAGSLYRWSREDGTAWLDANAAMGTLHCLLCKGGFFKSCPVSKT